MVEPVTMIAGAVGAFKVFQQCVSGVKEALGTAKDLGSISGQLSALMDAEQAVIKERSEKAGKTTVREQLGMDKGGNEVDVVINARLMQEQLWEVRQMVELRFPGAWAEIQALRAKNAEEVRERKRAAAARKIKEKEELVNTLQMIGLIVGGLLIGIAVIIFAAIALADEHRECEDFYKGYLMFLSENYETARAEIYRGKLKRQPKWTTCRLIKQEQLYDKLRQQRIRPGGFRCYYKCPGMDDPCVSTTGERFMCRRNMACKYDEGTD